jgi:hypothetical protein
VLGGPAKGKKEHVPHSVLCLVLAREPNSRRCVPDPLCQTQADKIPVETSKSEKVQGRLKAYQPMEARVSSLRQTYAAASQSHVFRFFETLSEVLPLSRHSCLLVNPRPVRAAASLLCIL